MKWDNQAGSGERTEKTMIIYSANHIYDTIEPTFYDSWNELKNCIYGMLENIKDILPDE